MRVNARMPVDEVNELLHAELPEGDWDTIGGLLLDQLGRVAAEGDTAEVDGFVLRAERVKGRRIGRVRIVGRRRTGADVGRAGDAERSRRRRVRDVDERAR